MSKINDLQSRLKVECDRIDISLAELARRIGLTPQAMNDVVQRGNMKATMLLQIAKVFDIPMEILMTPVSEDERAVVRTIKETRKEMMS